MLCRDVEQRLWLERDVWMTARSCTSKDNVTSVIRDRAKPSHYQWKGAGSYIYSKHAIKTDQLHAWRHKAALCCWADDEQRWAAVLDCSVNWARRESARLLTRDLNVLHYEIMRHYSREASLQHPRACHSAAAGEETAGDEGAGGGSCCDSEIQQLAHKMQT